MPFFQLDPNCKCEQKMVNQRLKNYMVKMWYGQLEPNAV